MTTTVLDLAAFKLIVFDKDGTLIDFDAMWAGWIEAVAERLARATGRDVAAALYARIGYDVAGRHAMPGKPLAMATMAELRTLTGELLVSLTFSSPEAEAALAQAWHAPDPIRSARPLADLREVFSHLRGRGLKIGVATTDDREPTRATLAALGAGSLVDVYACGDDGLLVKPAPDMLLAACRAAGVRPEQSIMVGDSVVDLQMALAAGAGLAIGVLSGVSTAADLAPFTTAIVEGIRDLA